MIKLTIEYNANVGHVLPDGNVEKYVDSTISYINSPTATPKKELISSVVILDAFRVAVKKGRINHKEVVILFDGEDYKLDKNGRLKYWPEGLADVYDKILDSLL